MYEEPTDLLSGIEDLGRVVFKNKKLVTIDGFLYSKRTTNLFSNIASNSCKLYFNNSSYVYVFIKNNILNAQSLKEGTNVRISGYLSVYGYYQDNNTCERTLVSPIIQIYCTSLDVLPAQATVELSVNTEPKKLPSTFQKFMLISRDGTEGCKDFNAKLSYQIQQLEYLKSIPLEGNGAAVSIAEAISEANALPEIGFICITRGGGDPHAINSIFNNPVLCEAIRTSTKPVLLGIGHSSNFTCADLVSDSPYHNGSKKSFTSPTELGWYVNNYYRKKNNTKPIPQQTEQKDNTKLLIIAVLLIYSLYMTFAK